MAWLDLDELDWFYARTPVEFSKWSPITMRQTEHCDETTASEQLTSREKPTHDPPAALEKHPSVELAGGQG